MTESTVEQGPLEVEEVAKDPWNYVLLKHQNRYFLSVVCGRGALFERNIELNDEELADFHRDGDAAIKKLARTVFDDPPNFRDRHIASLLKWPKK